LQAIHARHHPIENGEGGTLLCSQRFHCFLTILRDNGLETPFFHQVANQRSGDKIVLSDDNRQLRETRDSSAYVKLGRFRLVRLTHVRNLPGRREWNTLCVQHSVRSGKEHPTCPARR
jgi:hypothetical protein